MKMAPEDVLEEFIANAGIYESGQGDGKVIAECEDFDVQIFLSGCKQFTAGCGGVYPEITVIASGKILYDEVAGDEDELLEMIADVYDKYLTPKIISEITGDPSQDSPKDSEEILPDDPDLRAEEIDLRERELDCAIDDFLYIVYGEDIMINEDLMEELKDALLEKCAEIVDENIYRPMVFEDEDHPGEEIYDDFPYSTTTT